jgi:uncharacterized protein (DUF2164 family)
MRIELSDERRARLVADIQKLFSEELDDDIGELRAGLVLDFFVKNLGPPVYNQAIRDAHGFIQEKLVDLEGDFYEPDGER